MSPPTIKVCFVTNRLVVGGAERHAVTLANGLDPACFTSTFVTLNSRGPLELLLARERVGDPVNIDVKSKLDWSAVGKLHDHLERTQCEVIVAANPYPTLHAFLARIGLRRPPRLITTFHSTALPRLKEKLQFPLYRAVFMDCDALVYVSENQRRFWRKRLVRAKADLTIHNGIDTDFFSASAVRQSREETRRELEIAESAFVIGACAALRPEKRLPDLVEALARLLARGVSSYAVFIGDGPERGIVEQTARRLGVTGRIRITGYHMDVRRFILACDAMALPSHTETFSLSALESMALGRPMVMTEVGGASEQLADGQGGFLYQPGDIDALADSLLTLASPGVAKKMGESAARSVRSRFRLADMIESYSSLITSLAGRSQPG